MLNHKDVVKGIKGLTKAALRIDKSPENLIQKRLEICNSCEHKTKVKSTYAPGKLIARCKECKCFIRAKVLIKNEHCPINKW